MSAFDFLTLLSFELIFTQKSGHPVKCFIHINLPENQNQVVWVLGREPVPSPEALGKPLELREVMKVLELWYVQF
jgi:hypothetical protein